MFSGATAFNQDIGEWNVSTGTEFDYMFNGASAFNQSLSSWPSNATDAPYFCFDAICDRLETPTNSPSNSPTVSPIADGGVEVPTKSPNATASPAPTASPNSTSTPTFQPSTMLSGVPTSLPSSVSPSPTTSPTAPIITASPTAPVISASPTDPIVSASPTAFKCLTKKDCNDDNVCTQDKCNKRQGICKYKKRKNKCCTKRKDCENTFKNGECKIYRCNKNKERCRVKRIVNCENERKCVRDKCGP